MNLRVFGFPPAISGTPPGNVPGSGERSFEVESLQDQFQQCAPSNSGMYGYQTYASHAGAPYTMSNANAGELRYRGNLPRGVGWGRDVASLIR